MCPSTESRPRPMVTTDTCVPPARCHASMSAVSSPISPQGSTTYSPPKAVCRPAVLAHQIPDPIPGVDGVVDAAAEEDEAVAEPSGPLERLLTGSAKPDRDRARRLRHQGSSVNPVEAAGEVDDGVGEQPAEQLDLLFLAGASAAEVLAQGLVLHRAPADPDPQTQPAAGEQIDVGCLPGHQRRLALRQDQDSGGEPDPFRHAGQIREHHERVVERVPLGVRTGQPWRPAGVHGAEHMVIGEQVVEAQLLDRPAKPPDSRRVSTKLDLRIHHTDLHTVHPAMRS